VIDQTTVPKEWREWWADQDDEDKDMYSSLYNVWVELEARPRIVKEPEGWIFHGSD